MGKVDDMKEPLGLSGKGLFGANLAQPAEQSRQDYAARALGSVPPPAPTVFGLLSELDKAVGMTEELTQQLSERLRGVLEPPTPSAYSDAVSPELSVPLCNSLAQQVSRVLALRRQLADLLERIAL